MRVVGEAINIIRSGLGVVRAHGAQGLWADKFCAYSGFYITLDHHTLRPQQRDPQPLNPHQTQHPNPLTLNISVVNP